MLVVIELLSSDALHVETEMDVYRFVRAYASGARQETRRHASPQPSSSSLTHADFSRLYSCVRFPFLSQTELAEVLVAPCVFLLSLCRIHPVYVFSFISDRKVLSLPTLFSRINVLLISQLH